MRQLTSVVVLLGVVSVASAGGQAPSTAHSALDAAMQAFWNANGEGDRAEAGRKIVASGTAFDDVAQRPRAGRSYARQKTGRIELPSKVGWQ